MFDRNYTMLFAQICGFRIVVLANRFGCDNDLARRAHDNLIKHLDTVIGFLREQTEASLALARNGDPTKDGDLDEDRYYAQLKIEDFILDEPHPLLDHVPIDYEAREWFDRYAKTWHYGINPEMNEVSNRTLCGLRDILDHIRRETGLRFDAYLDAVSSANVDEEVFYEVPPVREVAVDDTDGEDDEYDPERDYELLHGPDW